jgi:hypothetical protein
MRGVQIWERVTSKPGVTVLTVGIIPDGGKHLGERLSSGAYFSLRLGYMLSLLG